MYVSGKTTPNTTLPNGERNTTMKKEERKKTQDPQPVLPVAPVCAWGVKKKEGNKRRTPTINHTPRTLYYPVSAILPAPELQAQHLGAQ